MQLDSFGYFEIKGGDSGRRFRINRGEAMNVEEYDETGMCICKWCFLPRGNLVQADILLAQKIALELFELEALQIAKKYPVQSGGSRFQSRTRILATNAA